VLQLFHRLSLPVSIEKTVPGCLFLFPTGSTRRDLILCVNSLNHNIKEHTMAMKKKAKKKAAKKKK
jgi:hypothetical protein